MKRFLLHILPIICTIFMASCSKVETDFQPVESVSITFILESDNEIYTRAISDGKSVNQLTYAIFNERGDVVVPKSVKDNVTIAANGTATTLMLTLPAGGSYKAAFWAQNSECDAYTISDDMTLTVDYNGENNDENRDAFWGISGSFTARAGANVPVSLKRPFAQVNAAAYPFDWEWVKEFHEFDAIKSGAIIYGVANEMNLLDGSVSGNVDAHFSPANMPSEYLCTDVDENGADEEYTYLSMSYVLADTEPSTHEMTLFFMDDQNCAVTIEQDVSIQRNHANTLVGQVISDYGELNIREYYDRGNGANEKYPQYLYYNISEPTTIKDKIYNFSDYNAGLQFASEDGQMITLENLYFTGSIWTIEFGEYRGKSYVNYNNTVNNVVLHNLSVSACIECHEWYFAPAIIAYGNTVLNNCEMTGTTSINKSITDAHGVTHDIIPVDLGVRNESDAIINGGKYENVFAWTHAVVNIFDAEIETLYCGTCDSTKHSWMTIESGTKINKVICCEPRCPYGTKEYSTTMTIKAGATVGSLQLVSTDVEFLIIEEGANVGSITCNGVEYTYEELRSAMGL